MSEVVDKRNKPENQHGQEYAHIYPFEGKNEEYQYPNEDKRVGYHAIDPDDNKTTEELYNIKIEETIDNTVKTENKTKIQYDTSRILEDHRQRSYRIKTKPQVYDKTDLGPGAYRLQNDPREDEVEEIKETSENHSNEIQQEQIVDLTSPNGRTDYLKPHVANQSFNVGDDIEDIEMGLKGKVAFIGRNVVSIVWEDNTRERINIAEASKFLKKAYVGDVEQQVDPVNTTPFPKSDLEKTIDNALTDIEASEDENDEDIDIEKVKLQRKVNELTAQVQEIDIQKIKEKAADELIDLMQKKGMVGNSKDEIELQKTAIMAMNDDAFETYKQAILSTKKSIAEASDVSEIEALLGDDDFSDIEDGQEFARAKEAMKKATPASRSVDGIEMGDTSFFENGGLANFKGNVGDFSSFGSTAENTDATNAIPRKLANSAERKGIQRKADSGLDLSGFNNLQGLTTPINIPNKDLTTRGKFDELFADIGWGGIPKGGSNRRR